MLKTKPGDRHHHRHFHRWFGISRYQLSVVADLVDNAPTSSNALVQSPFSRSVSGIHHVHLIFRLMRLCHGAFFKTVGTWLRWMRDEQQPHPFRTVFPVEGEKCVDCGCRQTKFANAIHNRRQKLAGRLSSSSTHGQ